MAASGWIYAAIMFVFVALSVWASASSLRHRFPAIGMWVSGAGQILASIAAIILLDFSAAIVLALPFTLYGLANIFNGYELSYPQKWLRLPRWLRLLIVGEMFAVIGTGFLLFFISSGGFGYTVTMISTIIAAIFVLMERSDRARFAMGVGAGLTGLAALAGGLSIGVAASIVLSLACFRVWWLKREARMKLT